MIYSSLQKKIDSAKEILVGDGFYPKYYQKKKHRDLIYLNVWRAVIIVVLGIVLGTVVFSIAPIARKPAGVADLAEQKEELEAARDIDQATQIKETADGSNVSRLAANSPSLDEVRYVASQPSVHVEIKGVTPEESPDPHVIDDDPAGSTQSDGTSGNDSAASANNDNTPTASDRLSRGSTEPEGNSAAGDSADTSSDTAESKPEETPPPTNTQTEKPKPVEQPKPEPKKVVTPKGITVYRVFAGYYDSKDEAVSRKKDLSTLGFSGTVQEGAGTYSIYVSEFDNSDKARALENKLEQNGFPDAFVARGQS